jgi:glycosyltransferase involved in cell wall biosynthesis
MQIALVCNSAFGTDGISKFVLNNHQQFEYGGETYHLIYSSTHSPQSVINEYITDFTKDGDKAQFISKNNGILTYAYNFYRYLRYNKINVVHINGSSAAVLLEVVISKIARVNKVVTHAHSTGGNHPFIHKLLRPLVNILSDEKLACGENAGQWMYGKYVKFEVIPNCINTDTFCFNGKERDDVRTELGLSPEEIVIGHVGYFLEVKNQSFLLKIMKYLSENSEKEYKMLLIGLGPMKEIIEKECEELGLIEKVMFLGNRNDICRLMMAMDVFCLPSLFEGFPIVAVEAQASGLPVFISNNVSKEIKITELVKMFPINQGADLWANALEILETNEEVRVKYADRVKKAGYDISHSVEMLERVYHRE